MNYLHLINRFWRLNKEFCFSAGETQLYFKLLDTCNHLGWKKSFWQSNKFICGETGMCERSLISFRKKLQAARLIDFQSGKSKREINSYTIISSDSPVDKSESADADEQAFNKTTEHINQPAVDYGLPEVEYPDETDLSGLPNYNEDTNNLPVIDPNEFPEREWQSPAACIPFREFVGEVNGNKDETIPEEESRQEQCDSNNAPCTNNPESIAANSEIPDNTKSSVQHIIEDKSINNAQMSQQSQTNDEQMLDKCADNIKVKLNKNINVKKEKEKEKKSNSSSSKEINRKKIGITCEMMRQANEVFNFYNNFCKKLPRAISLNNCRISRINARINEYGMETVKKMLGAAARSEFLAGKNERGWKANFDWIFNQNNFLKILEGQYDRIIKTKTLKREPAYSKPSVVSVLKEAYANIINNDDDFRNA